MDFGVAKAFCENSQKGKVHKVSMYTDTGTQSYKAPEMIDSSGYDRKVDLWAIGVLCYEMLTGNLPFQFDKFKSKEELYNVKHINFDSEVFDYSIQARDFIRRLLHFDPKKRLSAKKALQHPWILVSRLFRWISII